MSSRAELESKALTLLTDSGAEDQFPVPLEKIASYLGYKTTGFTPQVGDAETAKISGMIDYSERTIYVNLDESLPRQRFTLAHSRTKSGMRFCITTRRSRR